MQEKEIKDKIKSVTLLIFYILGCLTGLIAALSNM